MLFTENETNTERVFGGPGPRFAKDGINDAVVHGRTDAVNPEQRGTKASAHTRVVVPAGGHVRLRLRLTDTDPNAHAASPFDESFDRTFETRKREADAFYDTLAPASDTPEARQVMRQAFAGLLWSKQFYHYVVKDWMQGDPAQPAPPDDRQPRNQEWTHLYAADVISMPDKWEYPWYAAWDLAFHCVPLALVDSEFAKAQLVLMLREWYMHPNGQMSAYEWAFGDVNPPVHAWAAWRVYKIEKRRRGVGDRVFLERVFQKLTLNFTWWVNRKDADGRNVFQGGFLGLDNIGVFDRSAELPTGGRLEQSDGTSWMAMYSLNMMAIALELADGNPAYEDMASKFWEHFLNISKAMSHRGGQEGQSLWNEEDGFFYDVLHLPDARQFPIKVRSMVGLIPLFAVETLEPERLERLPAFKRRLEWFIEHRPDLSAGVASMETPGRGARRLLSVLDPTRLRRVLAVMLDEREFLSPYGVRALSRTHRDQPVRAPRERHRTSRGLRAGGVDDGSVRRQLELAWAHLVSRQLPVDRVPAEVPSLPRRWLHRGVSDGLGHHADALGRGGRALAPPLADVPPGCPRASADQRHPRQVPHRSALARPDPLSRVLPRRHGRGPGCEPPNRLDGPGREASAPDRQPRVTQERVGIGD